MTNHKELEPPRYELCARCHCKRPPAALMPWQDGKQVCADTASCSKTVEVLTGVAPHEEPKP